MLQRPADQHLAHILAGTRRHRLRSVRQVGQVEGWCACLTLWPPLPSTSGRHTPTLPRQHGPQPSMMQTRLTQSTLHL